VEFWPFVGAAKPLGAPSGEGEWSWDDWNGVVAISGDRNVSRGDIRVDAGVPLCSAWSLLIEQITLAKCSKETGFRVTEAFELDVGPTRGGVGVCVLMVQDELFDLAWSYHPHTFHPILAAGGHKGIVWIIDVVTKEMRVFQGHGHVRQPAQSSLLVPDVGNPTLLP
jgi:hypothetical protein